MFTERRFLSFIAEFGLFSFEFRIESFTFDLMQISVIIPTFNEEATIRKTLDAVARLVNVDEVIIVDGGSTDKTLEIVENYDLKKPFRLVRFGEANRGKQLHEGARHASHEIFWFLHADTRPAQGCAREIKKYMKHERIVGGNFQVLYDGGSRWARFMMWLHPQLQAIGLVYGDSAIFARREIYEKIGGYKPLPVLEDADFAKRLKKRGEFIFLNKAVTASSRRFEQGAFFWTFTKWSVFQGLYWMGVPAKALVKVYNAFK
jgi:rSAM/selenodomain-associated transferase 2